MYCIQCPNSIHAIIKLPTTENIVSKLLARFANSELILTIASLIRKKICLLTMPSVAIKDIAKLQLLLRRSIKGSLSTDSCPAS